MNLVGVPADKIELPKGFDLHNHFRRDARTEAALRYTARCFDWALVMPNLSPNPVLTGADAESYRNTIMEEAAQQDIRGFTPVMTIQITEATTPEMIIAARSAGVAAGKVYPLGVTTNSGNGMTITAMTKRMHAVWKAMSDAGMILCLHGEMPESAYCLDKERDFLPTLRWLSQNFSSLKIVLEHVTTAEAVDTVLQLPRNVAATITAHHLKLTLNDVIGGSLDPHAFCKPVAQHPNDRQALRHAATCGSTKFFFGSDSAPHTSKAKHADGCAGIFSAPVAIETLVEVFEEQGKLEALSQFLTIGGVFYGLPTPSRTIQLHRKPYEVPRDINGVKPYRAGETLRWQVM